jgi:4-hydroxy-3-polyprenylbenzoate decarboxylase
MKRPRAASGRSAGGRAPRPSRTARPAGRTSRSGARAGRRARRYLIGVTGASGAVHAVDFIRRCPGEKHLVLSDWARHVLHDETGLRPTDLARFVKHVFADNDLAAPFSSGSNRYDAFVVIPCSVSTLAKIAVGIADTLVTRAAQVALKERMRMILCVRETPLSSIALENALKLSREGVVVMPLAPPWYGKPKDLHELVAGFSRKVLALLGEEAGPGWREEELE